MHGQVSCLVGCLACRGSVWTPCMPLLYQSCKVKHYLLKTMYFFVQTRSHREYQCSRPARAGQPVGPLRPAVLLLRVETSTPTSPARVSRGGTPLSERLNRSVRSTRTRGFLCDFSPGLHLITTVPFLTGWVSPGRTWTGSQRTGCQAGGAPAGGRAESVP